MHLIDGYRMMLNFLDSYYMKNKSEELGELLGSMSLLKNNTTVDSAFIEDWELAVSQTSEQSKVNILSPDIVYLAMVAFLRNWAKLGTDGTISNLCEVLEKTSSRNDEWLNAVKAVSEGIDDPYLLLN